MTDTEILSEMIQEEALRMVSPKRSVELREEQANDSRVTISNMPQDAVVINVDKFTAPKSIFRNSRHECKRADYVIVSENKKRIIYIEMKRTKADSGKKEAVLQLRGAKCFIAYCKEIGTEFWECRDFLKNYEERFTIFTHTSGRKRATHHPRTAPPAPSDHPAKPQELSGIQHIRFDQIAG